MDDPQDESPKTDLEQLRELTHRASNFLTVAITQSQVGLALEGEEAKRKALETILRESEEWTREIRELKQRLHEREVESSTS